MFRLPHLFFLLGIFFSLKLANAQEELPRNLPAEMGAALWLKADERLELYAGGNGTVVSKWESKVGNLTATQSSSESARIEGNQTIGNNKAAIFFPPSNEGYGYFEIPSNFNLKNSTVLVSLKHAGVSEAPRVLSFSTNRTENDGQSNSALALMFYKGPNIFRVESNLSGPGDPKAALSPSYSSGNWTVLSYRIDGNGNMTVALDGVAGNQTSNPSMATANTGNKTRIGLGSSGPNATTSRDQQNLTDAHIYEILIFNKDLDSGNYTKVQTYMQQSMNASSVQIYPPPTASLINLGAAINRPLSDSILKGGNASSNDTAVAGNFTWSSTTTNVTQSGNYSVIFEPTLAIFNVFEFEVPVTVVSVTPDVLKEFTSRNGTPSSSQSISIRGGNVTASVDPDSGFEISTNNSTFGPNAIIPVVSGNASALLSVRLAAAQSSGGNKTAPLNISFGAQDKAFTLQGRVFELWEPYIEVAPEVLTLPVTTAGTPSASANFIVNAYNLSGNLTANATAGFEISLGNETFSQTLEIPLTGGNVTNAPLNLRVAASASAETRLGSVTLTSGNTTATLSVNGTVGKAAPPPPPPPPTSTSTSTSTSTFTKVCKCKKNPKVRKSQKCKCGIESNQQKGKNKQKKKKKSVFTFPQVAATSGSTWITADGKVVSENKRPQSNTSK